MPQRHLGVGKLSGPARGRFVQRMAKRKLEPDPRAPNGQAKRSSSDEPAAGLNNVNSSGSSSACSCQHSHIPPSPADSGGRHEHHQSTADSGAPPDSRTSRQQQVAQADAEPPPLLLHGARSEPSALLKLQGSVHCSWGRETPVQPMVDSGASGMGFVDPLFVRRCGAPVRLSSRRIVLADGSEVQAAGEATLSYSLQAFTCGSKEHTPPVRFTSTFIVTPLAPYELILGVGWLERHHAHIGFRERSIQLRVDGVGPQQCICPLERCNSDGSAAEEAAPMRLQTITRKGACKLQRRKLIDRMYMILVRPTAETETLAQMAEGTGKPEQAAAKVDAPVAGGDDPRIIPLLKEFGSTVFGEPKPGVPPKRGVEHAIQLKPGTVPPPARGLRHQSERDAAVLQEYITNGELAGILQKSTSPYGSMALVVLKKDGTPRVVIDYRALNEVTVKNKYPLPLMDELFDRTAGAQYFSTIDLRNGFHQIAIRPEDREKTAFRTRAGLYEYTVLPMGLCNAPGTFMQLMNTVFADLLDKSVLCFLDDILIFSKTEEEHERHIREVLTRLRKEQLYVKISKCSFMQREVAFLGHRIGADGLRVAPDKVSAVQSWPVPDSVTAVRSFLGLGNFYRRFVKDYSAIALPLTELTKEVTGTGFRWGVEQQRAFEAIKAALCSPPVLLVPDQSKPFVLNTDASKFAIGGVLQQDHGSGLQPVAYFSAKMSDAERNYHVREQEFLAVLRACQEWRHYLHGERPFVLRTDHDSIKYVKTQSELKGGRMARWMEYMAEFDYTIEHVPGTSNVVADPLSRREDLKAVAAAPPRSCLKKSVAFGVDAVRIFTPNPFESLAAARVHPPEPAAQRQRSIDAATKVAPRAPGQVAPNKQGTVMTPTQRCTAITTAGAQCAQRTAVAHLCWNHLRRDLGLRVQKSTVPGGGKGLYAAWPQGLPKGHRVPYTGDLILTDGGRIGGAYVLETRNEAEGIDAARRNAGLGRWVNDPRGALDERGRQRRANCDFAIHTPRGGGQRIAAVRTLRPILRGEELLVKYGAEYWRYQPGAAQSKRKHQRMPRKGSVERQQRQRKAAAAAAAAAQHAQRMQPAVEVLQAATSERERRFVQVSTEVLAAMETRAARVKKSARAAEAAAAAQPTVAAQPERSSARAGRAAAAAPPVQAPAAEAATAAAHQRDSLLRDIAVAAEKDPQYQALLKSPQPGEHAEAKRGALFDSKGCMRVPNDAALRTRILAELHDSPTGAHCGRDRLLSELQKRFFWDGMATQAEQYVLTCDACQRNKHSKQLKPGLLMPLPLPEEPCLHWTTDAVTGLPKSKRGYDAIQVYVDRLTKLKRFALAHTSDGAVQLASNTLRTIIGPHGMPKSMVSDRDPRITAKFWRELSRLLGSEVYLSTAHHPQSDGQSEREIQTVITALRHYVNAMGNDWDDFLPQIELALNSKQQASTGAAPFTLVYGSEARLPIDCVLDDVRPAKVPAAGERAERMKKALDLARSRAELAQARQKQAADRHRRLLLLKPGDQVLLATDGLRLRSGTHKLTGRFVGPFTVTGNVNNNAVTLELPPLLGALHSTFNISRLKVYRDGRSLFPTRPQQLQQPPAVEHDSNGVARYEVESLMAQRGKGKRCELLVRWKGYGAEDDQWKLRSELMRETPAAVAAFDALQADGPAAN